MCDYEIDQEIVRKKYSPGSDSLLVALISLVLPGQNTTQLVNVIRAYYMSNWRISVTYYTATIVHAL